MTVGKNDVDGRQRAAPRVRVYELRFEQLEADLERLEFDGIARPVPPSRQSMERRLDNLATCIENDVVPDAEGASQAAQLRLEDGASSVPSASVGR